MVWIQNLQATSAEPNPAAGLPVLTTANPYRVVTENVQLTVSQDGTVDVTTLTVYRNLGSKADGKITIPGTFTGAKSTTPLKVIWDNKIVPYIYASADRNGAPQVNFAVALGDQATHSLKVTYKSILSSVGYGKDQMGFRYLLTGSHSIDLFTMAYKYSPDSIFGLPSVEPDLGWEVGEKGASIREEKFEPDDKIAQIRFYWNAMTPLGKG